MDLITLGFTGIGVLIFLIMLRVPIAVALGLVGFVGIMLVLGWPAGRNPDFARGFSAAFNYLSFEPFSFVTSFSLVAIPLFLMMGYVAFHFGFTHDGYTAARAWLSKLPGGLAIASVLGSAMFAAVSGSSMATAAAMGKLAVPEMLRYKYDKGLATGTIAAAGTLGALIPPSILMIIYGLFTELSIGKLLIAGLLPGLLSAAGYVILIIIRATINPSLAPPADHHITWTERVTSLKGVWPIIVLFILVMGGIYAGIVTATEAAAIGAAGTWALAALARKLNVEGAKLSILETVTQSAAIFAIVVGAKIFVGFIAMTGVAGYLSDIALGLDVSPIVIILALSVVYIILGTFMDPLGIMLLTLPVIIPVIDNLGYDLIWFGVIMVKLLEIGMITPPVGLNVFVLKGAIGDTVRLETIFKGVTWFLFADVIVLVILIMFPWISLVLPRSF
ncbi:TRAP transporter large permease [Sneathiella sp.]|uniref:TRAP transporter large permease n=1 Tax=Sneathiella sp. TaxID=1964365 RepID=UPI002FE112C7